MACHVSPILVTRYLVNKWLNFCLSVTDKGGQGKREKQQRLLCKAFYVIRKRKKNIKKYRPGRVK